MKYGVKSIPAYFSSLNAQKSYSELCGIIVRLLREERERKGLSKYAIEQRSGVSQQMIGYVERGQRKPSLEIALRIADGLEVDLGEIITEARRSAPKRKK